MATTDSTAFPIYGQAFRFEGVIISASTLNPITGSLTLLQAQVSKNGGAFVNTTTNATEIGTSGYFNVDLSATEMTASSVLVRVTASNPGAVEFPQPIAPLMLSEFSGRADVQTPKRLEQYLHDIFCWVFDANVVNGPTYTLQKADGSTKVAGSVTQGDTVSTKGRLT